ncbi:MAG: NUDIX hydrolase [Parachlamydiales bacterium]|nr:NUDIX hydrolase [Parachlamydiales bacterium]
MFSHLPKPKVEHSSVIFEESYVRLEKDRLLLPDGDHYNYYTLRISPASVMILAKTSDNKFILNREYRHPTGRFVLGTPGGVIDDGEQPLDAGPRELLEETGYTAQNFQLIGESYSFPGILGQKSYYLYADNATKISEPKLELAELIHPILMSWDELQIAIEENADLDGLMCTAFFFYQNFLMKRSK